MELKNYTQKHFELVASVIASIANSDTRKVLAEDWALRLSKECGKFKSHLFLKACGVESKPENGTVVPVPPELKTVVPFPAAPPPRFYADAKAEFERDYSN